MFSKKKINQGFKVDTASIPSPIGGLNARDSIANMPETDALILDNYFPSPTSVDMRRGSSLYALTGGTIIETIMAYNGASSKKLFCIDETGITNITAGSNPTPDVTGLSNARFQYVNFTTPGGHFILCVNGADKLRGYNGTSWYTDGDATHDITGVDSSTLIQVNIHKNRVWFTQKDSTKAYYLDVNSIAGKVTSLDLGPLFRLGGYLMGMMTWTINDSSGLDEYAVFVSSEGECVVYRGYDPSSPSTWAMVGTFRIGRPIGRRFFTKVAADAILITVDGVVPLSQSLLTDRSSVNIALSDKIINLVSNDTESYNANFGWQVILFPIGNKLLLNVPSIENNRSYQYVMNTISKAWCTFGFQDATKAWNANCFEIFNDALYYGNSTIGTRDVGGVYRADHGQTERANPIIAYAKPAFSYFKKRGIQKYFTMARPIFAVDGTISAAIAMNVDFNNNVPDQNYLTIAGNNNSPWNTSLWNVTFWSLPNNVIRDWQTVNGIGFAGTLTIAASSSVGLQWQSTDYVFQTGGIL